MQLVAQQLVSAPPDPLATVCFGLGIAALLFVFRRTIFQRNRQPAALKEMESLFANAHAQIKLISEHELYHKLRHGYQFSRYSPGLSEADRQVLNHLAALQPQGVKRHG
jgi:hypothetical protein